ncbi:Endonuclease/exonuclease/phosphatase superfamily [Sesbania bispinosa]|nr:Endonuclease/exonuclease/phosphatase superfamily [Sesbania bispinosa]
MAMMSRYHNMQWEVHSRGDYGGDPLCMDQNHFFNTLYGNSSTGAQGYVVNSNLDKPPDNQIEEYNPIIQDASGRTHSGGEGAETFPGLIRDLTKMYNLNFVALLEPRISGSKAENAIKRMGFSGGVRVEAQVFSGGIWCLWRTEVMTINVLKTTAQCIHLQLINVGGSNWVLSIVYASPNDPNRDDLWTDLSSFGDTIREPWCVMGDFNSILYDFEKVGGARVNRRSMNAFANCLDHCGIWLQLNSSSQHQKPHKPFKFLTCWLSHPEFKEQKKKIILKRLEGIDRKLRNNPNPFLSNLRLDLWNEYENILAREEEYWLHQSRINWLNLRDRNTHFYHQATVIRRARNRIEALQDESQNWI